MIGSLRNLLLVTLTGWTVMAGCGGEKAQEAKSQLDIVGGSSVSSSLYNQYFTSIVSLQYGGQHFCGGTLVASNKVVTAAHCLADFSSSQIRNNLRIVIGARDLRSTSGAERFSVSSYSINSRYNASRSQNDTATITLNGSSSHTPVEINQSASFPAVGSTVYVAGWGSTYEGGYGTSVLKYTAVKTVSNSSCAQAYGSDIYDGNICAYASGTDSCQGDSGGPLYTYDGEKMTLVGIVSWGNGCARQGYPGVYARTSYFNF
ncbi:serine protease [Oligoflexus tunisiensis]|uniref:serine protease n=1 Tax=Oligoflexus tunisiensis TaxID=708132 RepID=UPI00159F1751|nr:serine protease [Oligoflexus tunisiensis]